MRFSLNIALYVCEAIQNFFICQRNFKNLWLEIKGRYPDLKYCVHFILEMINCQSKAIKRIIQIYSIIVDRPELTLKHILFAIIICTIQVQITSN